MGDCAESLMSSRAPNPNWSLTAGELASPTDVCKTDHFAVLTTGLQLYSLLSPTDRARIMCKWYLFSPQIGTYVISKRCIKQPVMQKEKEVRLFIQGVVQNEF